MMRFTLEDDESFEKQCGKIFLTTKGRISFHCTLCEEAYCGFESYQAHINQVHLLTNFMLEKNEIEMNADTETETYFEIEINNIKLEHDDFLELSTNETKFSDVILENETTCDTSLCSQTSNNAVNKSCSSAKDEQMKIISKSLDTETKPTSIQEVSIPIAVRKVVKRNVYIAKTTPEEDRKHKCPICGFGFKEKANMKHHLQRHSNERNHACSICDKRFYTSTELNTHKRTHTLERPLLCTECGETFATKGRLGDHLKRHRGQKDYHCQHSGCKKSFYNSSLLKNHMQTHSTERRLVCSVCSAAFKQKVALKNHLKLHENKREFKCKICRAEFNQTAGLYSHMKSVHKSI